MKLRVRTQGGKSRIITVYNFLQFEDYHGPICHIAALLIQSNALFAFSNANYAFYVETSEGQINTFCKGAGRNLSKEGSWRLQERAPNHFSIAIGELNPGFWSLQLRIKGILLLEWGGGACPCAYACLRLPTPAYTCLRQ